MERFIDTHVGEGEPFSSRAAYITAAVTHYDAILRGADIQVIEKNGREFQEFVNFLRNRNWQALIDLGMNQKYLKDYFRAIKPHRDNCTYNKTPKFVFLASLNNPWIRDGSGKYRLSEDEVKFQEVVDLFIRDILVFCEQIGIYVE